MNGSNNSSDEDSTKSNPPKSRIGLSRHQSTEAGGSCGTAIECSGRPIERMFPFVLRARILLIGRETLRRSKRKLHFVLITTDASEAIRAEVLSTFAHYPVVQHFTAADLENFFNIKGAKTIGFAKSGLAQSIYAELKQFRINRPPAPTAQEAIPPATLPVRPGTRAFRWRPGTQSHRGGKRKASSSSHRPKSSAR